MKILSLFTFLIFSFGCFSQVNTSLAPADFKTEIANDNIQVLDVRTPGEFQSGHIHHALLADWNNSHTILPTKKEQATLTAAPFYISPSEVVQVKAKTADKLFD